MATTTGRPRNDSMATGRKRPGWADDEAKGKGNAMTTKRSLAAILGGIAAVLLFYLVNPWITPDPKSTISEVVTVGFWISFGALLVVLFEMRKEPGGETIEIEGPAFTRFLFGNSRAGLFWLPDPPVRRLHLAGGRLAQGQRDRLARWRHRAAGLLAARGRDPRAGRRQPGDHLRLVPHLPADPARQPCLHLVRPAHRVRRDGGRARPPRRPPDRLRRLLRGDDEHVLPARGLRVRRTRSSSPWPSA